MNLELLREYIRIVLNLITVSFMRNAFSFRIVRPELSGGIACKYNHSKPILTAIAILIKEFDGALDCISMAVTCTFNRRGTLLAVGCNDGRIVVWDFLTRGIAKIISAHVHPVCSLW